MPDRSKFVRVTWGQRNVALRALGAVLLVGLLYTSLGRAASVSCPGTFRVEHNDKIGKLSLPGGPYTIKATNISCAASSQLFTQFLNDWDGRLPGGWRTTVQGVGHGTFVGPRGQSFVVQKAGGSGGGGSGLVCSQRVVLKQDDRIGPLVMKKGSYIIDRLGALAPSCSTDAKLLTQFLMDFDGILPNGWVLLPDDGTFVHGSVTNGFRVEPDPDHGGGGNQYPKNTLRCRATFRVQHNDRIGALRFPAGPYWVSIYKGTGITCPQSSRLFASFLQRTDGKLPAPWVINVPTGSFRRGKSSPYGFVAKPAFNVGRSTRA
jgi:hypothetical protein